MSMTLVQTVTVGSGGAASISFTGIPQDGTDLVVVYSLRGSTDGTRDVYLQLNGSSANFSNRYLLGTGSSAVSNTAIGRIAGNMVANDDTASTFSNGSLYLPNYTSSSNKSGSVDSVTENNATAHRSIINAILWSNTAAITSLLIEPAAGNFVQHSTASLYKIVKA